MCVGVVKNGSRNWINDEGCYEILCTRFSTKILQHTLPVALPQNSSMYSQSWHAFRLSDIPVSNFPISVWHAGANLCVACDRTILNICPIIAGSAQTAWASWRWFILDPSKDVNSNGIKIRIQCRSMGALRNSDFEDSAICLVIYVRCKSCQWSLPSTEEFLRNTIAISLWAWSLSQRLFVYFHMPVCDLPQLTHTKVSPAGVVVRYNRDCL